MVISRASIGAIGLFLLIVSFDSSVCAAEQRPNIVVVLADDLGYGDLACFGHPEIKTPHLDRFASESLKLTSCYASHPNCSPSRAGLMTGRTPYRAGIHNWIPFMSPMHLRSKEVTIATLLKNGGYDTCHSGKWHLNGMFNLPGQPQPNDHGFRHWFSVQNNALPNHRNPYNFVRNGIPQGPLEGYSGPIVAQEAVRWLEEDRDKSQPFFLFVCFHEPHEPIATDPQYSKYYDYPDDPSKAAYYGNVTQLDAAFGQLMAGLEKNGLRDSTLVWFTSDNGPARTRYHNVGSSGPLREFKGHIYEGGIRVPGLIRWPSRIKPGTVSDVPVSGVDLFPTLCAITGEPLPENRHLDGISLLPLFDGKSITRTQSLYWHFNWASSAPKVALRKGDWKLLGTLTPKQPDQTNITQAGNDVLKSAKLEGLELYHLGKDIGETHDLANEAPEKLTELYQEMRTLYAEVQRETPTWPEWVFPRYEGGRIEWPDYVAKPLKK